MQGKLPSGLRRPGRHGARPDAACRPFGADEEEMIPTLTTDRLILRAPPARGFRTLRGLLGVGAVGLRGRPARPARRMGGFRGGLRPLGDRGLRHMVGRGTRDRGARRRDRLLPPRRLPRTRTRLDRARRARRPRLRLRGRDGRARLGLCRARGLTHACQLHRPGNARSIRLAERLGARRDTAAPGVDTGDVVMRHPGPDGSYRGFA